MTDALSTLDDLVVQLTRRNRTPAYRRALLKDLPHGLGIGGLRVLRSIERATGAGAAPTVKDIAADQAIEHSTASRAASAVVEAGLVQRSTCADDHRKTRLHLTPAGQDALAQATSNRQAMLSQVTSDWDQGDIERLNELLSTLVEGFADHLGTRTAS